MIDRKKCIEMAKFIEKIMLDERSKEVIDDKEYRELSHIRQFLIGIGNYICDHPSRKKEIDSYIN